MTSRSCCWSGVAHTSSSSVLPVPLWIIMCDWSAAERLFLLKSDDCLVPEEGNEVFFFFFKLRLFKDDGSWQMHRSVWLLGLRTWIGSECDAHQPLINVSVTDCSWGMFIWLLCDSSSAWVFIFTPSCIFLNLSLIFSLRTRFFLSRL